MGETGRALCGSLFSRFVVIGVGATILMDLWALVLRQLGIPSLNFAFLGR
jgi:hypothetical protein